jgi:hypothetical protein
MKLLYYGLFLCFLSFLIYHRESFDGTPYEYTQGQGGEIQQLHDTLQKVTLTEALLDSLQSDTDQTTDQINQLQTNMNKKTVY